MTLQTTMDLIKTEYLSRPASCATLLVGEISAVQAGRYLVRTGDGEFLSERAESCLLLPVIGDRVLLSAQLPEEVHLLAVLTRSRKCTRTIVVGEGATLAVSEPGHLEISAQTTLRLRSAEIGLLAQKASVMISQISTTIRDAFLGFSTVRWVGDTVEASVGRVTQWIGASQRTVRGLDQVRSGSCDVLVDQVMTLQGKQVLISAEKLARIDADQVHIG